MGSGTHVNTGGWEHERANQLTPVKNAVAAIAAAAAALPRQTQTASTPPHVPLVQEPIDVLEVDGKIYGFSGCHRFEAHVRLGREQILCRVRKATPQVRWAAGLASCLLEQRCCDCSTWQATASVAIAVAVSVSNGCAVLLHQLLQVLKFHMM